MHYATSWKVAGSIPNEVFGFLCTPNPSSDSIALRLIQSLIEMSTRNLLGVQGRRDKRLTVLLLTVNRLSRKCGSVDLSHLGFHCLLQGHLFFY
jgi:hypothetical protein